MTKAPKRKEFSEAKKYALLLRVKEIDSSLSLRQIAAEKKFFLKNSVVLSVAFKDGQDLTIPKGYQV